MIMGIICAVCAVCAAYFLFMNCLLTAYTIRAAVLFKFIPFCCFIALLVCAMNEFGWIQIF